MELYLSENGQSPSLPHKKKAETNLPLEILFKVLKRWYWLVLSVAVCYVIAKLYLRYAHPIYNIECRFLVKNNQNEGPQNQELAQLNIVNNNTDVTDELEILRTKLLMKRTVHRLQLNVGCITRGRFKSTELYGTAPFTVQLVYQNDAVPPRTWDCSIEPDGSGMTLEGNEGAGKYHWGDTVKARDLAFIVRKNAGYFRTTGNYQLSIVSEDLAALNYMGLTKINQNGDETNIIEMDIADELPQRGEDILNTLYSVYTEANVEDQNSTSDNIIEFINNRLTIVQDELSGEEKKIQDFKTSNKGVDLSDQSKLAVGNSNDLQHQLVQQDVQLEVLKNVEDYLRSGEHRMVPPSLSAQDPVYQELVGKYNTLLAQRDNLAATSGPRNPLVAQLNGQLDTLKDDMLSSLENDKAAMMTARESLAQTLNKTDGLIESAPAKERTFLDISREQQVKQQLYLFLLQKREETAISKSGTLSNTRLIDPARSDGLPFSPNHREIYMIAFAVGLLVPTFIIALKALLNNTISDTKDVAARTNAPILGVVGHNKTEIPVVVGKGSRSIISEQFRAIRANLQFMLAGKRQQVILVTSSMSGEGKSFVSLNIASSLAITGKRVVLLELDLRKPRLSSELGMPNQHGFTNYIVSNEDAAGLPKPVPDQPNLYLIGSGPIPPNPAELLMQEKIKTLFDYLNRNFDYVVIDTPPIGLVTDALIVAQYADVSAYLTRHNYTFRSQIENIEELFVNNKLKNMSIIVNDYKEPGSSQRYGRGYGYGYGYGYGGYYSDEKEKKGVRRFFPKIFSN